MGRGRIAQRVWVVGLLALGGAGCARAVRGNAHPPGCEPPASAYQPAEEAEKGAGGEADEGEQEAAPRHE